jgi:SAM-dependent methyltransferase
MMAASKRFSDDIDSFGSLDDPEGRARRGRRIVALLRRLHRDDLAPLQVLDVGCSAGLMTREVSRHVAFTVGVDPDPAAMHYARAHVAEAGRLAFVRCSGEKLPFADETFDIALCNHVYEHANDPVALMHEVARVLRKDGVCYFAGGHTWQIIEPHYRLPFLSLLPRSLAARIVRSTGRGDRYDICFLPPWKLRRLFAPFERATPVTAEVLRDPEYFGVTDGLMRFAAARAAVRACAPLAALAAPTRLWLLTRK